MLAQVYYESQSSGEVDPAATLLTFGIMLIIGVFYTACLWRVFTKAGRPGWYCLVPILNTYTLIKIAGKPGWWLLLFFVPCVSIVVAIIVYVDLAKEFGKSTLFGLGLVFLSPIFLPILAFGSAEYWTYGSDRRPTLAGAGYAGTGFVAQQVVVPPRSSTPWTPSAPVVLPPLSGAAPTSAAEGPAPAPSISPPPPDVPTQAAPPPLPVPPPQPGAPVRGWYDDPADASRVRWWDGAGWTDETRDRPG